MRLSTALLALACAAWSGALTQEGVHNDHKTREKRQTLLPTGAGAGCADWALLNYLLYYYLIQAQTTDAAQVQHQQTDHMAAALLKLLQARGTDPLPTLLSQPAGQASIITLLQRVTDGDTGRLLLLLADIRDQGRLATMGSGPGLGQAQQVPGQPLAGPLAQHRPVFGPAGVQQAQTAGLTQRPFPGVPAQAQFGQPGTPAQVGASQPGLTGRQASGQRALFGPTAAPFPAGPQPQAQTAANRAPQTATSATKPPPTSAPSPPPTTGTTTTPRTPPSKPPTTRAPLPPRPRPTPSRSRPKPKPRNTPKPRPTTAPTPAPKPAPTPALVRSRVLPPSTSLHVTTATLVTTILLRKTKTVPAVRGDTPTSVQHVHTVTHVVTATGLQTETLVVTPTLVISAGSTSTVFGGAAPPRRSTREALHQPRRRRRRSLAQLQPSLSTPHGSPVSRAATRSDRTPELPPPAPAEA